MKEMTEITLDLSCRHAPVCIYAKQGDIDSRYVSVRFNYGGREFDLSQVSRSEIRVKKPDGTLTVNGGSADEEGEAFVYPLTEQSLAASGEAQADFLLYGSDNAVISCIPARLFIAEAAAGDESVTSTNEYTAFRNEFDALKASTVQSVTSLSSRVAALEGAVGGISLRQMTREKYDALESPNENTIFYVTDDNGKVTQYLGSTKLSSGISSVIASAVFADSVPDAVLGVAEIEEV